MWAEGRTSPAGLELPPLHRSFDTSDPFDPNTWQLNSSQECRIYGDDNASMWAVVDEIDYQWALQWAWSPKWSRGRTKVYLRRVVSLGPRHSRYQTTVWLHLSILKDRMGIEPPSPEHTICDHRNGNGLDCRRENLRWATVLQNRHNRFGRLA